MQVKQDKYNLGKSSIVQITQTGADVILNLQLNPNTLPINFAASVSGKIVDSLNNPVAHAIVKLMNDKFEPLSHASSDKDGNYIINNIISSPIYTMIAISPGKALTQSSNFTLSVGQHQIVDFTLPNDPNSNLGLISGYIADSSSPANKPIAGAVVSLYTVINNSSTLFAITYTDAMGDFVFSELPAENYNITISALGYISTQISTNVESGRITSVTTNLSKDPNSSNGIISGVITNNSNTPIPNADVILYNVDSNKALIPVAFTTTNSSGIYTFINVPIGTYLVKSNQSELINVNNSPTPTPTPTLPTSTSPSMKKTYNVANGMLSNGARLDDGTNFAGWIGGPADGSSTLNVVADTDGVYNLSVQYIGADTNRPLKIDVNGINTGIIYTPPMTNGWTINDAKTFTTTVNLKNGNNTLKFHGNGIDYGPSLGEITLLLSSSSNSPITPTPTPTPNPIPTPNPTPSLKTYNAANGILSNGARLDDGTNFAGWIGGPANGSSTLNVVADADGVYNLSVQYIGADTNRPLKLDINGVNTGIIYTPPITNGWTINDAKTFTITVSLNMGNNTIKFHGNGIDYGPSLGQVTLELVSISSMPVAPPVNSTVYSGPSIDKFTIAQPGTIFPISYNVANGILANGARLNTSTNFVDFIGGTNDGSATVNTNVTTSGLYNLAIQYISTDMNRPLKIIINGIDSSTIYNLPMTSGWTASDSKTFTIPINLNIGNNSILFHGDGVNYSPSLGSINLTVSPLSGSYDLTQGILENGANVDITTGFVSNVGGRNNGSVTIQLDINQASQYNLGIQYLSPDAARNMKIDINGVNTGTIYNIPQTIDWSVSNASMFNLATNLNSGTNIIKFYGNGITAAPDLGTLYFTQIPFSTVIDASIALN
ncbi:carboxypeptidase regulatory-like domain-containing protein [Clostridium tarantellae]|uniref:Uncharacterized protein n=1 Tax=Clostridium tarantellae TaxID=39493 RepID=A0A6I1MNM1_9CLOT|nr:carboxypeptidase regulatory-like domain-containing protein [Clostridium tarantellae]MPQ43862.1 hypothetical protein [Clostridium tarantellae]